MGVTRPKKSRKKDAQAQLQAQHQHREGRESCSLTDVAIGGLAISQTTTYELASEVTAVSLPNHVSAIDDQQSPLPSPSPRAPPRRPFESVPAAGLATTADVNLPKPQFAEVRSTPHKGQALFATKKIPAGALVLAESPIIRLTQDEEDALNENGVAGRVSRSSPGPGSENYLETRFSALSKPAQKDFLRLFDSKKSGFSKVKSIYYSNCYNLSGANRPSKSSPGGSCIGLLASRINHSCVPNVQFSFVEGPQTRLPEVSSGPATTSGLRTGSASSSISTMTPKSAEGEQNVDLTRSRSTENLPDTPEAEAEAEAKYSSSPRSNGQMLFHAIRTIPRGREILSNYNPIFETRAQRQRTQTLYYGFQCDCEACDPPTEFWTRSDERRRRMIAARKVVQECELQFAAKPGDREHIQDHRDQNQGRGTTRVLHYETTERNCNINTNDDGDGDGDGDHDDDDDDNIPSNCVRPDSPDQPDRRYQKHDQDERDEQDERDKSTSKANDDHLQICTTALLELQKLEALLIKEGLVGAPLAQCYHDLLLWSRRRRHPHRACHSDRPGHFSENGPPSRFDSWEEWKRKEADVVRTCFGEDSVRFRFASVRHGRTV